MLVVSFSFVYPVVLSFKVETPLNTAKKLIKLTADKYDTSYSFQLHVSYTGMFSCNKKD